MKASQPNISSNRHKVSIQRTATEAHRCKESATKSCYTKDTSISSNKNNIVKRPQTPLLNRFYGARSKVMHKIVICIMKSLMISAHQNAQHSTVMSCSRIQLLILGAGIDVSYEVLLSSHKLPVDIFLVDFPEVIELHMKELSANYILDSNVNVIPISGDLREFQSSIWRQLISSKFSTLSPTLVISECVLCYLDTSYVEKIITFLAQQLSSGSQLLIFDPIIPITTIRSNNVNLHNKFHEKINHKPFMIDKNCSDLVSKVNAVDCIDGYSQMIIDKFSERGAPLLSSTSKNTTLVQMQLLVTTLGWSHTNCYNLFEAMQVVII